MSDPVRQLKLMPWLTLLQVAGLTIAFVIILDFMVLQVATYSDLLARSLMLLFYSPLGLVTSIAIAYGIGALAVYLMERVFQTLTINTANLWGLVLCLIVVLVVKSLLPIPGGLVDASQTSMIGIMVGVFVSSRKYWRRYS